MITVKKRDGSMEAFNIRKVVDAIYNASEECGGALTSDEIETLALGVKAKLHGSLCNVEDIQDVIECALMNVSYSVAKAFILYRYKRQLARYSKVDDDILSLVHDTNEEMKWENSNKNTRLNSTQRDYIAGIVSRDITERVLLPERISKAHRDGVLHFHDADYFLSPMFNCFSGTTRFITDEGVKSFNSFHDGECVTVLDKNGDWREATVHNYGKMPMVDITFKSGRTVKTVTCTQNHRWILKDGTVTTNIKIGDSLALTPTICTTSTAYSKHDCQMWALGFILGDGYKHGGGVDVRLCGDKVVYAEIFRRAGYSLYTVESDGEIRAYKTGLDKYAFIRSHGWNILTIRDKQLLFEGYYSADGCTDRNRIFTSDLDLLQMIMDISSLDGYYITSISKEERDTNYKEGTVLYNVGFRKYQNPNNAWIVESIKSHRNGALMETWCVEEPITHTFLLDGGMVTGNCCLIQLGDMLDNGTVINGKMVESPKSFRVACTVMTQIIAQVASNQYGGQSIDIRHLSKYLARSIASYKDKGFTGEQLDWLVHKELSAGVQTIQYQINTLIGTNGQSPFVTLFLHIDDNDPYKAETAMIIKEILEQRYKGIKNECGVYTTPAFPKLIYVLDENNCYKGGEFDWLTDVAVKCSAKRMYPDYISAKKMKEIYEGNVFSPMGCRSFLSPWKDENGNYKFEGRFNQGVVSINLPQIGILCKGDTDAFWKMLDERCELCKDALMVRHKALLGTKSDVSPIHWQYGVIARLKKGETIDKLLYGGCSTLSLGYIGLYEVTKLMTGVSHTDKEIGEPFARDVMQFLRAKCDTWKKETNIGFALYGTPAETLGYRFAKIDLERFGEIEDITDKGYYTNSYHVDVREDITAFEKFSFESQFQPISSGGCISYVEIPNMTNNLEAMKDVVKFGYENIQYFEFNAKSDYCHVCGFDGEIVINDKLEWECPCCHNTDKSKMNVVRRVCGYLSSQYFNVGKTKEIKLRKLHL